MVIVGSSGSGKTTLVNLMARFYDPDLGTITLGGRDMKDFEVKTLLSYFSLVFQNVYLFIDTVANNICIAKPHASTEEVMEAVKTTQCHEFIITFPECYEMNVSEESSRLSGGQRQRISIGRVLIKDASSSLLDEGTSSVD